MEIFSNPLHLTLLIVVIVLLFGASKLGDVGGALGKSIREFKKEANNDDGRLKQHVPPPTSGYVPPTPTSYTSQSDGPLAPPAGYVPAQPASRPEYLPGDYRPQTPPQAQPPAASSAPPDYSAR
ncbi:MAG: twin-arginine translocase TatA/TatE family subunit [Dehalococcoidia bacterium]